jgi:hypothetical protein
MGRKIFYIIFLLAIAYGIWSFINFLGLKIRYRKLVDQSEAIVKYTPNDSDDKIKKKLLNNAKESGLKLTDYDIDIYRYSDDEISIGIDYEDSVVLPLGLKTYYYDQKIHVSKGD